MKFIIGIDPGVSGAVAILTDKGELVQVFEMPTVEMKVGKAIKRRISAEMLTAELRLYTDQGAVGWVEHVSAMPGQGVSSMFAFGEAYGLARGVLAGLLVPTYTVPPAVWKKRLQLNSGKDGSRAKAAQIWPAHAGEFRRVKDDGKAEAALIAHWALSTGIYP